MKNKVTKKQIRKKKATTEKEKPVVPSPITDPFADNHMHKAEAEGESVSTESGLLQVKEMPDQITPGNLIVAEEVSRYQTIDEKYQEIQIDQIEHFLGLPDFVARSRSKFPFIIETPLSLACIEGWDRIQEARAEGKTRIACHVEEILEYSEEELCLRKAAVRVVGRGGRATYSESMRNVKILAEKLLESEEDLVSFGHGGDRRGSDFVSNNRGENVRGILTHRLELSLSSINQMIAYGQFLDDETINFFAVQGVSKHFFEAAQANKRWMINDLRSQEVLDEKITHEISKSMMGWFDEYTQNDKKIMPVWDENVVGSQEVDHTEVVAAAPRLPHETSNSEVSIAPTISTETCDEPVPGTETSDEAGTSTEGFDDNHSFESLKFSVEALAKRLGEANAISDPDEYLDRITAEAKNLSILVQKASVLRTKGLPFTGEVLQ
jgi:hypothetical protein